jgi:hypothetical protein
MTGILTAVALEPAALGRLRSLPGVNVRTMPTKNDWEVPAELRSNQHILLCKYPPKNLFDVQDLHLMQLATVGYEHIRHLGLADRRLRVCTSYPGFCVSFASSCVGELL